MSSFEVHFSKKTKTKTKKQMRDQFKRVLKLHSQIECFFFFRETKIKVTSNCEDLLHIYMVRFMDLAKIGPT